MLFYCSKCLNTYTDHLAAIFDYLALFNGIILAISF